MPDVFWQLFARGATARCEMPRNVLRDVTLCSPRASVLRMDVFACFFASSFFSGWHSLPPFPCAEFSHLPGEPWTSRLRSPARSILHRVYPHGRDASPPERIRPPELKALFPHARLRVRVRVSLVPAYAFLLSEEGAQLPFRAVISRANQTGCVSTVSTRSVAGVGFSPRNSIHCCLITG